jgi:hypothetical protein
MPAPIERHPEAAHHAGDDADDPAARLAFGGDLMIGIDDANRAGQSAAQNLQRAWRSLLPRGRMIACIVHGWIIGLPRRRSSC